MRSSRNPRNVCSASSPFLVTAYPIRRRPCGYLVPSSHPPVTEDGHNVLRGTVLNLELFLNGDDECAARCRGPLTDRVRQAAATRASSRRPNGVDRGAQEVEMLQPPRNLVVLDL